jgi:hypothetical protein
MAADEIERFRWEIVERTGDRQPGENITDRELLREVMNTVGKPGRLGDAIRCVTRSPCGPATHVAAVQAGTIPPFIV